MTDAFSRFWLLVSDRKSFSRTDRQTLQKSSRSLDTPHRGGYYFYKDSSSSFSAVLSAPWTHATLKTCLARGVDTRHAGTPQAVEAARGAVTSRRGARWGQLPSTPATALPQPGAGTGFGPGRCRVSHKAVFKHSVYFWKLSGTLCRAEPCVLFPINCFSISSSNLWLWLLKQPAIYEAFCCFRQGIWTSKGSRHPLWTINSQRELALLCVAGKFINTAKHYVHLAGKRDSFLERFLLPPWNLRHYTVLARVWCCLHNMELEVKHKRMKRATFQPCVPPSHLSDLQCLIYLHKATSFQNM